MKKWVQRSLMSVARRISPEVDHLHGEDLTWRLADVVVLLYGLPLAVVGVVWLVGVTDLAILIAAGPLLALIFLLMLIFSRLDFFSTNLTRQGTTVSLSISLNTILAWASALIVGPEALWVYIPLILYDLLRRWRDLGSETRWGVIQNAATRLVMRVFFMLVALLLYQALGGVYPLPALSSAALLPVCAAMGVWLVQLTLFYQPITIFLGEQVVRRFIRVMALANPFAILAALIYVDHGVWVFLFFNTGVLLTALLANRLSRAMERTRQRYRELETLEALGRDMMGVNADSGALPSLLGARLPQMFPRTDIEIRLFPAHLLILHPTDHPPAPPPFWAWLQANPEVRHFPPKSSLPWGETPTRRPLLIVPILSAEGGTPLGGIYLRVGSIYSRWDRTRGASLIPALQSLAAQIASALNRSLIYEQTLAHQKLMQEVALAGEIQTSFLPHSIPTYPGWQISALLEPARQTAGDFYDLIPLPNGCLGIVVADVADKGLGAALFMALSRTLLRTYAAEYFARPDLVLAAANKRIVADTESDMFVTVFYGILDPRSGALNYANAGHNAPYLLSAGQAPRPLPVGKSIPLGLFAEGNWRTREVKLQPGDLLVMYTDGITEARNGHEEFFGEARLLQVIRDHAQRSTQELQNALAAATTTFMDGVPPHDDLTLVLLKRVTVTNKNTSFSPRRGVATWGIK